MTEKERMEERMREKERQKERMEELMEEERMREKERQKERMEERTREKEIRGEDYPPEYPEYDQKPLSKELEAMDRERVIINRRINEIQGLEWSEKAELEQRKAEVKKLDVEIETKVALMKALKVGMEVLDADIKAMESKKLDPEFIVEHLTETLKELEKEKKKLIKRSDRLWKKLMELDEDE